MSLQHDTNPPSGKQNPPLLWIMHGFPDAQGSTMHRWNLALLEAAAHRWPVRCVIAMDHPIDLPVWRRVYRQVQSLTLCKKRPGRTLARLMRLARYECEQHQDIAHVVCTNRQIARKTVVLSRTVTLLPANPPKSSNLSNFSLAMEARLTLSLLMPDAMSRRSILQQYRQAA